MTVREAVWRSAASRGPVLACDEGELRAASWAGA